MGSCPDTEVSPAARVTVYLVKNDRAYLKRPYADIALLVEDKAKVSGVAIIIISSPNLVRQVRALVKSVRD